MFRKGLCYIFFGLTILSCREDYTGELPVQQEALSLFAELSPGSPVELIVVANPEFGQQSAALYIPDDAILSLSGTDMNSGLSEWSFVAEEEKYVITDRNFRPREQNTYEIHAHVPGYESDTLIARTYIPPSTNINKIKVVSNTRRELGHDRFNHQIHVNIQLAAPSELPAYFQLIPRRALADFRVDQNGQIHITDTGEYENMDIIAINSARNAVYEWEHKDGVIIDYARLNGADIDLMLTSRTSLSSLKEVLDRIQFELRTLSPDLFEYHRQLNRRIVSHQSTYSYPITAYTNVQNGKGVFGSYSMSFSSVKLK